MTHVEPVKPQKLSKELTDEELKLQKDRGLYHRKLMRTIISDMVDAVDRDQIGLCISGGVDSTTILWQMLELGIRPRLYTIQIPTVKKDSADTAKAKALAEKYSLPLNLVTMPRDPDEIALALKKLSDDYGLAARADFEVVLMYRYLIEAAQSEGCTSLFTGIADEAIHMLGRKKEIRARQGKMSISETNYMRMFTCGLNQTKVLVKLASSYGVSLGVPLMPLAHAQPYFGVPWNVTNLPRKKEITMRSWEKEERDSGIRVVVNPMQCGDSGSREYYDGFLRKSDEVVRMMGRVPNTAMMYYNYLKRTRAGADGEMAVPNPQPDMTWYAYVTGNIAPEDDTFRPAEDDGTAKPPNKFAGFEDFDEESANEESLFDGLDSLEEEESDLVLNPDGTLDNRIDCFGYPFWLRGAETTCERAKAGLCGQYQPDFPHEVEKCSIWLDFMGQNRDYLKELASYADSKLRPVYEDWADKAYDMCDQIRLGTRSFD